MEDSIKRNYTIKDWQPDDRPRERFAKHGPASLSDSELLAIILRTGTREKSAKDVGVELLDKFGGFSSLEKLNVSDLSKIKGIGMTKAITLAAVFEIARRIKAAPFDSKKVIRTPEDVTEHYIPLMRGLVIEEFRVLLMSTANQIIKDVTISKGTLNASIVHPREVFKAAVSVSAASIILLHNHPSGNPNPSKEDIRITKQLVEAGKIMDIKIYDHLIIAGDGFYSFARYGLI